VIGETNVRKIKLLDSVDENDHREMIHILIEFGRRVGENVIIDKIRKNISKEVIAHEHRHVWINGLCGLQSFVAYYLFFPVKNGMSGGGATYPIGDSSFLKRIFITIVHSIFDFIDFIRLAITFDGSILKGLVYISTYFISAMKSFSRDIIDANDSLNHYIGRTFSYICPRYNYFKYYVLPLVDWMNKKKMKN